MSCSVWVLLWEDSVGCSGLKSGGLESSGGLFCHVRGDSMPGLSGTVDQRGLHLACPCGWGLSQNGGWVPKRASRKGHPESEHSKGPREKLHGCFFEKKKNFFFLRLLLIDPWKSHRYCCGLGKIQFITPY